MKWKKETCALHMTMICTRFRLCSIGLWENQKAPWTKLVAILIPIDEVESFHVFKYEIAKNMDVKPNNYITPNRDNFPQIEI